MQRLFGSVTLLLALAACGEEPAPVNNDNFFNPDAGGQAATTTGTTGQTTSATGVTTSATGVTTSATGVTTSATGDTTAGQATTGGEVTTTGETTGGEASTTGETTGGETGETTGGDTSTTGEPVQMDLVGGTYMGCSSYGERQGDMCAGWLCNVTLADVEASLLPQDAGPCANSTAEEVCDGAITIATGRCARAAKSNPVNILMGLTNEQLRPEIRDCIYEDPAIDPAKVSVECTECFIDVADCAGSADTCLDLCLLGDSPECDNCRLENGCDQMAPPCAGIPNPF